MASSRASPSALHVLGLWLLYAFVGILIAVVAMGSGDMPLDEDKKTRTRFRTKLVGAASGLLIGVGALGSVLLRDPKALSESAMLMATTGWSLGAVLTIAAWMMIARDLRHRKRRRE
jgi:hypothetical protein